MTGVELKEALLECAGLAGRRVLVPTMGALRRSNCPLSSGTTAANPPSMGRIVERVSGRLMAPAIDVNGKQVNSPTADSTPDAGRQHAAHLVADLLDRKRLGQEVDIANDVDLVAQLFLGISRHEQ